MQLSKIIGILNKKGLSDIQIYCDENKLRFIQIKTQFEKRKLLLYIPSSLEIITSNTDHLINLVEYNYKFNRHRKLLENLVSDGIGVYGGTGLSIHFENIFRYYQFCLEKQDEPEEENIGDIDDYPVIDIFPVLNLANFLKMSEQDIDQLVLNIDNLEENNSEKDVEKLIETINLKKVKIKQEIFEIHKSMFHLRRDIKKFGNQLKKLKTLEEKAVNEKDTTRFNIERKILEINDVLSSLNTNLKNKRIEADTLLENYFKLFQ